MFVNMRKDYGSTRRAYLALLPLPNLVQSPNDILPTRHISPIHRLSPFHHHTIRLSSRQNLSSDLGNMAPVSEQLQVLEHASGNERVQGYATILQQIVTSADSMVPNLVAYIQSITSDHVGVINSRPLLSAFVEQFRTLSTEVKLEVG